MTPGPSCPSPTLTPHDTCAELATARPAESSGVIETEPVPDPEPVRHSSFILSPYSTGSDAIATWQLLNTLVPYSLLWVLLIQAAHHALWFTPPILVALMLFSGRCFSLMHDCGHQSLFRSRRLNRVAGFLLGVVNAIPQVPWSQGHAYHHKHNGNWELYKGPSALISAAAYSRLSPWRQRLYRVLRHPLMLIPGGFFYLVIKPRLALLLGAIAFARHAVGCLRRDPRMDPRRIAATYASRHWYSTAEFHDLLLNNLCVVASWVLLCHWIGAGLFWSLYAIVMACSAALFICIFFVQHNFEGSYAHRSEGWSPLRGSLEGTSLLRLPPLLNWFTADIGHHNIHHLCERIPNYRLRACHERNAALLAAVPTLVLGDIPSCFGFILWDEDSGTLQTIATSQAAPAIP